MELPSRKRLVRMWETGAAYHLMFVMLLALFVVAAVSSELGWDPRMVHGVYLLVFFEALVAAAQSRRQQIIGALLFVPGALSWLFVGEAGLANLVDESAMTKAVESLSTAGFLFFLVGLTVVRLFRGREVSWTSVSAATSGFLMLGLAWSGLHGYVEQLEPGSYRGLDQGDPSVDFLYFSFVTLSTLGYGDIVPVTSTAKMITVLEAVVGQLFLVVLIARLVGMVGTRHQEPAPPE